ncbi:PIR protein [Plasmodium vivax]|uniref:VIR protein n=1 Tax=Plasmodium vivax TaxID=5855 RepID=A0A565A4E0_PLAVI|nr:PIR protein [Plasmodium vivax]
MYIKYNFVNFCKELWKEIQGYSKDTSDVYDGWCDGIKSEYERYNIFNENSYNCRQVMFYLYFIISENSILYNENRCKYLYYWIYHDLLQKNTNYDVDLKLYRSFLEIYFGSEEDPHICNNYVDQFKNIMLKKSEKLIELYDTINNNGNTFDCFCAKNCSQLYNEYVKECQNDYDYDCCSELQSFKYKYDKKMESIDKCEGGKKILPSAIKHDLHVIIIIPMIIFTPIGSRITHRKRRKSEFFENNSYRTNTLLPTSGRTRTEQNIANNIAYNSTKYS